ncbi:MAG: hypothetical protein LC648_09090, partial [Novosphingobium sp.]|nr:hypothetical protein [Novosphingobium sp.]
LERMAARTAEFAASNVAAAGALAAAASSVASLPAAAADGAVAAAGNGRPGAVQSLQALPEAQLELEPSDDALLGRAPAREGPAEPASLRAFEAEAGRSALTAEPREAGMAQVRAEPAEASIARFAVEAPGADAAGGGQLMEALLLAAQAGEIAGQRTQDVAAVQEAFGDTQGTALVDAVVAHFAGAEAADAPLGGSGDGALAALLDANVGGTEAFVNAFQLDAMIEDHAAAAAVA